jgi:hypothetical protein
MPSVLIRIVVINSHMIDLVMASGRNKPNQTRPEAQPGLVWQ